MKFKSRKLALIALSGIMCVSLAAAGCSSVSGYQNSDKQSTTTNLSTTQATQAKYYGSLQNVVEDYASEYVMVRHKSLGGSHYAYTEGITDDFAGLNGGEGNEGNFFPGSQLVKLSLSYDSGSLVTTEEVLIDDQSGVVRDPDVSPDGTKIVFSWKTSKSQDDFHLYIYYLEDGYYEQITFGQGISDTEPKWVSNDKIVFSSTRCVQIVDCWKTPVSNLYTCKSDGSQLIRVGYDQVHTTYPTVTEDGRVLYTRWDYNDRTQMYVHGVFSMNADGTGQTAVYGNNTNNPTSVLHTVGVPGNSSKYLTVVAGHHVYQGGKLAWLDTSVTRDGQDGVEYIFEGPESTSESYDTLGQTGPIYKYPIAINDEEILYAKAPGGWASAKENTSFNLYYTNTRTGETVEIANNNGNKISCSQLAPIKNRTIFQRPSMVNYAGSTGTYYVANVYKGETMENVKFGDVKYLRVVALDYRAYAVGAVSAGKNSTYYPDGYGTSDPSTPVGVANSTWDVKQVLGIVPVEADGSVLFSCPSDIPVYFQLLDENGFMIQSMRSWSTLMPGETFSCVGCHEDKNNVPLSEGTVTLAMKKGIQTLQKDIWMTTEDYEDYNPYTDYAGFSYANEIQPILDASCVSCHTNVDAANKQLGSTGSLDLMDTEQINSDTWYYKITTKSESVDYTNASFSPTGWTSAGQPFGSDAGSSITWGATSDACFYMTQTFTLTNAQLSGKFYINWRYDEDPEIYLNGTRIDNVAKGGTYVTGMEYFVIDSSVLKEGTNTITARAYNALGGSYMDIEVRYKSATNSDGTPTTPIALTSEIRTASRDKVDYMLSYLVLTGASLNGNYYVGRPTNQYTDWIGGMSDPTTIDAYTHGSTQSGIIDLLLQDHYGLLSSGKITMSDIARIAAWIDLGVPFRGSYDEASENWGALEMGEAERRQNMRDYYSKIDELTKAQIAGKLTNKKVVIEYYDKNDEYITSVEARHLAILYGEKKIEAGDTIKVILPNGYDYVWFSINPKMKLSLMYCPNGEFTYTVPTYAENILPNLTVGSNQYTYTHPTITAFLPSDEDLNAIYNVALNPYDASYGSGDEKITAGSTWENDGYGNFFPSNAFDGFTNNRGHGSFPVQSWGPNKDAGLSNMWLKIDLGREVELYYFDLYIRADFPHDSFITELTLELLDEDGNVVEEIVWNGLTETNQAQRLTLENAVKCSAIKIKNIKSSAVNWFGISEFEAYGKNVL